MIINESIKTICISYNKDFYLIANIKGIDTLNSIKVVEKTTKINNIYNAKITEKNTSLNLFFVELTSDLTAILPINKDTTHLTIGQTLLVQVVKDIDSNGKKIEVSTNITLQGIFSILLPYSNDIKFSKNIDQTEMDFIKREFEKEETYGLIIRSTFHSRFFNFFNQELFRLKKKWDTILQNEIILNKKTGLVHSPNLADKILLEDSNQIPKEIIVNSEQDFTFLEDSIENLYNFLDIEVKLYSNKDSLFSAYNLEKSIESLLSNKVILQDKNVELIFLENEIVNYIDINFKPQNHKNTNKEEDFYNTNLSIVDEIFQEIQLRNLSGQILIDFLKIKDKSKREKLYFHIKDVFQKDKNINIFGFSRLGIFEITRRKTQNNLTFKLQKPCYSCKGSGLQYSKIYDFILKFNTLQNTILRDPSNKYTLSSNKNLLDSFKNYFQDQLSNLSKNYNLTLQENENLDTITIQTEK